MLLKRPAQRVHKSIIASVHAEHDPPSSVLKAKRRSGAHAQQLCRAVSEAGCSMLAAAWQAGDQAGVKAAFLPLSDVEGFPAAASTGTERQVTCSLDLVLTAVLLLRPTACLWIMSTRVLQACPDSKPAREGPRILASCHVHW